MSVDVPPVSYSDSDSEVTMYSCFCSEQMF